MADPLGSVSSSNPREISFGEVEGERFEAPRKPEQSSSAIEQWRGEAPANFVEAPHGGPMSSGPDLAAQSALEAAERRKSMKAVGELQGPLSKLASKYPDPLTFFGNVEFKNRDVAFGALGDALRDPAFTDAAAKLSASDVRAAVTEQVKKAWPQCTPNEVEHLKQYFMGQVAESLRERVAPRMQDVATKMLDDAAKSFDKTADDPAALVALAKKLTDQAHPLSDPDAQASVRDLRAALGLDVEKNSVTPEELKSALQERAGLLHQEARKMKNHDRPTLFRALAEQDVGSLFKQATGVREGSLLDAQIAAVRAEGERENTTIGHVKFASVVVAVGFTGGLGGAAMGVGVSLSMSAPAVLEAWQAVDTARAGESAGTMEAGAGEEAQRRAVIETGAAVLSAATAAGASHALHGVAEKLAAPAAKHMADGIVKGVIHGAVEGMVEQSYQEGARALDESLGASGGPVGKNALQRAASSPPPLEAEPRS